MAHIYCVLRPAGYTVYGNKLLKPAKGDAIDDMLARQDDPNFMYAHAPIRTYTRVPLLIDWHCEDGQSRIQSTAPNTLSPLVPAVRLPRMFYFPFVDQRSARSFFACVKASRRSRIRSIRSNNSLITGRHSKKSIHWATYKSRSGVLFQANTRRDT